MKPGTLQVFNKKMEDIYILKHSFDLFEKPTFIILEMNDNVPRKEKIVDTDNLELYSKIYNKIFGPMQLTLDLDNV